MQRRNTSTDHAHARRLRRDQTPAEARLWRFLRSHRFENLHFRRQHPIGNYIADFCSPKARLVIELDGAQHLEQEGYDAERTAYLEAHGYRVLRFWNHDVMGELDLVALAILEVIQTPPQPSPI